MTMSDRLPAASGVGFKPKHIEGLLADPGPVAFIEVHAENYMGDGGIRHAQLAWLRERFALSIHGVGLSIGGAGPYALDLGVNVGGLLICTAGYVVGAALAANRETAAVIAR